MAYLYRAIYLVVVTSFLNIFINRFVLIGENKNTFYSMLLYLAAFLIIIILTFVICKKKSKE